VNIENYLAASRVIHETLGQIATTTYAMAWSGCADMSNPQFAAMMKMHGDLIASFQKLHSEFIRSNPEFTA
jgi:hypothetical protein